jgi:xanthine permease XanP
VQGSEDLAYRGNDRPAAGPLTLLTLQHTALVMVFMVYPVAIAQAIGLAPAETGAFLAATLFACAAGTVVQVMRTPWGSGQLGVLIPTPVMLPALVHVGSVGGVPLIAGFAWLLAASELLIARLLPRLKFCFPPEVCGVVIIGLGLAIGPTALMQFTGAVTHGDTTIDPLHLLVASLTLASVIGATLFAGGRLRLIAVGVGLIVGSLAGVALGLIPLQGLERLRALPWFGAPSLHWSAPSIDIGLLPIAILLALVAGIDNLGAQVGIQRLVDPGWRRIDFRQGSGSVQANAAGDLTAGLLWGMPVGLSSSHVGLMFATRAAARVIAPCTAVLLVLAGFMPKLIELLSLIPRPVVGALMAYTAAYLIVSGMQLTQSRLLSDRRMFTVGLSLLIGLMPLALPGLKDGLPPSLQPLYESSLSMSAVAAIGLTLLFRIGIRHHAALPGSVDPFDFEALSAFFLRMGRVWGAQRDLILRATRVTGEALEALALLGIRREAIDCELQFDEDTLRVVLNYRGPMLDCPERRPPAASALDDDHHLTLIAGHLVRRSVDQLLQSSAPDGTSHQLTLRFEQ